MQDKHNHSVRGLGAPGIGGQIYPREDKTKTRWLTPEILPDEKEP